MAKGTRHTIRKRLFHHRTWALLVLVLTFVAPAAHAWSHLGHRMICAIALMQLEDTERAEIERLAERFRTPDGRGYRYFTQGCTFADEARGRAKGGAHRWRAFAAYDRWHYVNPPRSARELTRVHCDGDCVVHGIEHHFRVFANHDIEESRRATALLMMAHFIGDAHQPLHTGFADDLGGNRISIEAGGFYLQSNLHAVWDNGILAAALGEQDWWQFAERLSQSVNEHERVSWLAASPLEWARESFDIATEAVVEYCRRAENGSCRPIPGARKLDPVYQAQVEDIALDRIRRAGTRLADYLSRGLKR